jgi:hypothetical protein
MVTDADLTEATVSACAAELASRGMLQVSTSRLNMRLSLGIVGSVGLPGRPLHLEGGKSAAIVQPVISVRHEETSQVVLLLRGFPQDDDSHKPSMGVVSERLEDLMPERKLIRHGWIASDEAPPGEVARRVADDVVLYGFPFMERLRTADALFEEMKRPPHRFIRKYDLAVMFMLQGYPVEAQKFLKTISSPISHNPVTWADGDQNFAAFLAAFEKYFNVDLEIDKWPLREPPVPRKGSVGIAIRDRNVVRFALQNAGRDDIAEKAAGLGEEQLREISQRVSEIVANQVKKDLSQAIAAAAAEFISQMHH